MGKSEHAGASVLREERDRLLMAYDHAARQTAYDQVKTEHGNVAEAVLRKWLREFLPKRYGVTKGYIITPDRSYEGPVEEWDVIVYDALESPVLYIRQQPDQREGSENRGIPVQYVRAVIETKATFNTEMANKAVSKLMKLRPFLRPDKRDYDKSNYLPFEFCCYTMFFEAKVNSRHQYAAALAELSPLITEVPLVGWHGGLILRGFENDRGASHFSWTFSGSEVDADFFRKGCELSTMFRADYLPEMFGYIISGGFSENEFWRFMLDFVAALKSGPDPDLPGIPYERLPDCGFNYANLSAQPLFALDPESTNNASDS